MRNEQINEGCNKDQKEDGEEEEEWKEEVGKIYLLHYSRVKYASAGVREVVS